MTNIFIMVSYGRMGMNFSLFFNDVISCLNLYDKVSEVYHSVANSFFLDTQVCFYLSSL